MAIENLESRPPMNGWKKFLFCILGVGALLATKYVLSFSIVEPKSESSVLVGHGNDERKFVLDCTTSTVNQVMKKEKIDQQTVPEIRKTQIVKYSKDYCGCVAASVYKTAQVALPHDDRRPTSDDEVDEFTNQYLKSPEGQIVIQDCRSMAESEMVH